MGRRRNEPTRTLRPIRLGIYLETKTHKELLLVALTEDTSATALVERLIKDYLRRHRKG